MFLMLLLACDGGLTQTKSCDLLPAGEEVCQEYQVLGPDAITLAGTCAAVGGEWRDGECPAGSIGGCEDQDPSNPWSVIEWYYPGIDEDIDTPEDVQAECANEDTLVYVPAE